MYCGVPSDSPVCVIRAPPALRNRQRDAEVRHEGLPLVHQDVLGLEVAVNDAVPMRVVERARNGGGNAQGFVEPSCFSRVRRARSVSPST